MPPVSQALLWKVVKEHVDGPEFTREQQAEILSIFDDEKEKHSAAFGHNQMVTRRVSEGDVAIIHSRR